jgi:hypothetical protein
VPTTLRDGLAAQSEEWGLLSEHLAGFISPEHIFSARGGTEVGQAVRTAVGIQSLTHSARKRLVW